MTRRRRSGSPADRPEERRAAAAAAVASTGASGASPVRGCPAPARRSRGGPAVVGGCRGRSLGPKSPLGPAAAAVVVVVAAAGP